MLFQKECRCTKIYVPGKQTANEQFQLINIPQSTRPFGSLNNIFLRTEKKKKKRIITKLCTHLETEKLCKTLTNKQTEKTPYTSGLMLDCPRQTPHLSCPSTFSAIFPTMLCLIVTFYIQLTLCPLSPCSSKPTFPRFLGLVREAPPRARDEWLTRTTSLSSLHTAEQNPSGQKATPPDLALQQQRSEMQLQRPSGAS